MSAVADLAFIGAPVDDPVKTASFIGGMILTRRQKASLLKEYLSEKNLEITPEIKGGAQAYVEVL